MSEEITTKEEYYKSGNLWFRLSYKNGELHGLCESWWDNNSGNLSVRWSYKNGKYHGLSEWWYVDSGTLQSRINYKNGKRHGLHEEWWKDRTLYYRRYYFNDKLVTEFEFDVLEANEKTENE